jgi:hypothetical protein
MSTEATPTPSRGGTSALMIVVLLVALVGVVFAITFLGETVPPDPLGPDRTNTSGGEAKSAEPPLRFYTSVRRYDPPVPGLAAFRGQPLLAPSAVSPPPLPESSDKFGYRLQDRTFQGFYEPGEKLRAAQFWFENRNPAAVAMQLQKVNCGSCSGGGIAAVPADVTKSLFQNAALSALPVGPFNAFALGMAEPAAALKTKLEWKHTLFADDPHARFVVPAAPAPPDKWAPWQLGILEMNFKVKQGGKNPLEAQFVTAVEGTKQQGAHAFALFYETSPASETSRTAIDVGELDPLSAAREFEFLVFSNTRGPDSEFGDLVLNQKEFQFKFANGTEDKGPFFQVTAVARLSPDELSDMTERLFRELKKPVNVRSAYRVALSVRPKAGDARLDIGSLERNLVFEGSGVTQSVRLTGIVRGQVWLDDNRTSVALPTFSGSKGLQHEQIVKTAKGVEVKLLGESAPANFKYELEKLPDAGTESRYKLKIGIPSGIFGQVKGEVVLEAQGPQPQKVRIPVSGAATF